MIAFDLLVLKAELGMHSNAKLCRRLGISDTMFYNYIAEPNKELPDWVAMAAAAVRAGLEPYKPGKVSVDDIVLYGGETAKKAYEKLLVSTQLTEEPA